MSIVIRLLLFLGLSILAAYLVEAFGFGIVHSLVGGIITFLLSPGVIVIFVGESVSKTLLWVLFVVINIFYYEVIFRLIHFFTKKVKTE